jgi:hypothetical protein
VVLVAHRAAVLGGRRIADLEEDAFDRACSQRRGGDGGEREEL